MTYLMLKLRSCSSRSHIPHKALPICTSTNQQQPLATSCTIQNIDKLQRLHTLALRVPAEGIHDICIRQIDQLDKPRGAADSCQLPVGRDGQSGDAVCGRVHVGRVGRDKDGRFEDG